MATATSLPAAFNPTDPMPNDTSTPIRIEPRVEYEIDTGDNDAGNTDTTEQTSQ